LGVPKSRKTSKKTAPAPAAPDEVAPRIARRERRRERSREEIVEAARRVILAKGLAGTTLEAVAAEVGLTKAALYYYYPSKDALMFEIVYATFEAQVHAIQNAVRETKDGGQALRAIIRETIHWFAPRLDDFRLVFMHNQVAGPEAVKLGAENLARIYPLNNVAFSEATQKLADDSKHHGKGRARVEPRMLAFLANVAAYGILTMKGMVEAVGDPLLYSDEQLIDALARVFEAAAAP
jgi:AcrR family transcriptional regulator